MITEDLLKPRYKVIADWPGIKLVKVGDILYLHGNEGGFGSGFYYTCSPIHEPQSDIFLPGDVEKYPHLFCKLSWWEDREEKDFPKYVKNVKENRVFKIVRLIQSKKYGGFQFKDWEDSATYFFDNLLPAAETEYTHYTQSLIK